jgi:hypothetical protein
MGAAPRRMQRRMGLFQVVDGDSGVQGEVFSNLKPMAVRNVLLSAE